MNKYIRLPGFIFFAVVFGAMAIFGILFMDGIVKGVIESKGTELVGAKVELARADLTLSPMGLTLTGLKVTDPDQPMSNLLDIERIAFLMDSGSLLMKKVIVDDMSITGIRMNTPRKRSGAIGGSKPSATSPAATSSAPSSTTEEEAMPSFSVPSVSDILKSGDLESLTIIKDVETEIKAIEQKWKDNIATLPGKDSMDSYKKRINNLKSTKIDSPQKLDALLKEIDQIKRDIDADTAKVNSTFSQIQPDIDNVKARINDAKDAPARDIKRLKEKYSLSPEGLQNFSRMLLGPKVNEYIDMALGYYDKASPYMDKHNAQKADKPKHLRGKGINVKFTEHDPKPSFLVRKMSANVILPMGSIDGQIMDITTEQNITRRPTTLLFESDALTAIKSLTLSGTLTHIEPGKGVDVFNLKVNSYEIKDVLLSESKDFPVTIDSGLTDITAKATLRGRELDSTITGALSSLNISTGSASGALAQALGNTLQETERMTLSAKVDGTLPKYRLRVSSDLDKVLQAAVGKLVKEQSAKLERDLKRQVDALTKNSLADVNKAKSQFDGTQSQLSSKKNELAGLKNQGDSAKDEMKNKLGQEQKQKIDSQIKSKLKGLKLPF
jgi:uncharacterized protein (TIGR03545 family)